MVGLDVVVGHAARIGGVAGALRCQVVVAAEVVQGVVGARNARPRQLGGVGVAGIGGNVVGQRGLVREGAGAALGECEPGRAQVWGRGLRVRGRRIGAGQILGLERVGDVVQARRNLVRPVDVEGVVRLAAVLQCLAADVRVEVEDDGFVGDLDDGRGSGVHVAVGDVAQAEGDVVAVAGDGQRRAGIARIRPAMGKVGRKTGGGFNRGVQNAAHEGHAGGQRIDQPGVVGHAFGDRQFDPIGDLLADDDVVAAG